MESTVVYVIREKNGHVEKTDEYLYQALLDVSKQIIVYLCGDFILDKCCSIFHANTKVFYKASYDYSDYQVLRDVIKQNGIVGDELLFVNNSIIGPFFSLKEIINEMHNRHLDFWGLTRVGERVTFDWKGIPPHLQLCFFAMNRRMFESKEMKSFLEKNVSVAEFEMEFTTFFEQAGFSWGSYINIERYNDNTVTNNIDLLCNVSCELLEQYGYPFFKKDYFITKSCENSNAEDLRRSVEFIDKQHLYDMDIFWECILHQYNISDIKDAMNLCYILPEQRIHRNGVDESDYKKTVIIMHIGYEESIEEAYHYMLDIPKGIKIIVVVINDDLKHKLQNKLNTCENIDCEIRVMFPNRGRDMNALFVTCRDVWTEYRYLCFTHDKRTSGATGAYTVGKTFMNILWQNTVITGGYISNVIETLKKERHLGYLTVPAPYHAGYFKTIGDTWGKSYGVTKELSEQLGLQVAIREDKLPFAIGNGFWCKTDALMDIVNYQLKTEDFHQEPMPSDGTISHALERIMIYAAQNRGYYSGIVESTSYAQSEMINKSHMLQAIWNKVTVNPYYSARTTFERFLCGLQNQSLFIFFEEHPKVYIFGAGKSGYDIKYNLKKIGCRIQGYICSDGYKKPLEADCPVYYLSEIDTDNPEVGIILAVHKKFYKDLQEQLLTLGDRVYYL